MASPRMPAVFIGHGTPMNALLTNRYTDAWRALGRDLAGYAPRAVLAVSAHWYIHGTAATAMPAPRTIHDFGGFPQALFDYRYPAEGEPALAAEVQKLLDPLDVDLDQGWGLDHGTWSVLAHLLPDAGVPVVQLSIDRARPPEVHYEIGRRLAPLRDENVLILGSGNVVHHLGRIDRGAMTGQGEAKPHDWALRADAAIRAAIASGDHETLIDYRRFGEDGQLAIPTPEHYLPLLYVLGAQAEGEPVSFPVEGIDLASISMLSVRVG